jgi:thymidine kinase (EC 2.7.1.21)
VVTVAKLYFRYGAMNSGKSTALLQAAHNYEERGQRVVLLKPRIDTKGEATIVSRLGVSRPVDVVVEPEDNLVQVVAAHIDRLQADIAERLSCVLVDEAQFLSPAQVEDLFVVAVQVGVPVLAYGIRTDFQTVAFPGSRRLLEISHSVEELKTICRCGKKAIFNARTADGEFIFDGDQVAIDGVDVGYESLCGQCYLHESGGRLASAHQRPLDPQLPGPDPDFS